MKRLLKVVNYCRMVEFRNLARNFYVSDHLIDEIRDTYNIPITETEFVDEREEWG